MAESTILQIAMYLITAAFTAGTVLWRIKELEKKVEKHNNLVERMVIVEQCAKALHERVDHIEENGCGIRG